MLELIKTLCAFDAPSGREENVRDYIISRLPADCKYKTDSLGNLLVEKKGKNRAKNRVMLASHMDEVGMIVTHITDKGFIKFTNVGGIETASLLGKTVRVGDKGLIGAIGVVPIHLRSDEDERKYPEKESLYVDCGAKSKDDFDGLVSLGDRITFVSDFEETDGFVKCKALDDRAGCAVLLDMINSDLDFDTLFAFTVQEEVGLRGAGAAAFNLQPDYAVVVETTTASDIAGVKDEKEVCHLGEGAVIPFMDRSTVYSPTLFNKAKELSQRDGFKMQTKTVVVGGNDAGAIHKAIGGVRTLTVSFACRYLHSPCSVIAKCDIDEVRKAVRSISGWMANA